MNLQELIDHLQSALEDHGPDTPVYLAHQPEWPFRYAVSTVGVTNPPTKHDFAIHYYPSNVELDIPEYEVWFEGECLHNGTTHADCEAFIEREVAKKEEVAVYIAEGRQIDYLPQQARAAVGW